MTKSNVWAWLGTVGSAFLGAGTGWAATQLGEQVPTNGAQWKGFGLGFLVTGAVAVANLLRPSPLVPPPPPPPPPLPEQRL